MATDLTGKPVSSTYNQLLHVDGGPSGEEKTVYGGAGVATALKLGTDSASIDNIRIDGNTISTIAPNSDLVLTTNGSGKVKIINAELTTEADTIFALRSLTPTAGALCIVKGYYTPGDGGGGPIRIGVTGAAPGTYVDNGGSIIVPIGGDGSAAWIFEWTGEVSAKWFGAVGDGITDDTVAIQKAIDYVASKGGGYVDLSAGRWLIDSSNLLVKQGVVLRGFWKRAGETNDLNYTNLQSSIILNPSYTINLVEDFSGVEGLVIVRKGMTVPTSVDSAIAHVAAFAGTAITVGDGVTFNKASDTYVANCLVVGFNYAYYNVYNERPRVEYLQGDCTNGIYMDKIYDMDYVENCHFWPFTTTHRSWASSTFNRQGVAFYFGEVDWGQITECFSYGYKTGIEINGSHNVVLLNCGIDGLRSTAPNDSKGIYVHGQSGNIKLIGCKVASHHDLVYVDFSGNASYLNIVGCSLHAPSADDGKCLYIVNGHVVVTGTTFHDAAIGIYQESTANSTSIICNTFSTITTPFLVYKEKTNIFGNIFDETILGVSPGDSYVKDNIDPRINYYSYTSNSQGVKLIFNSSKGNANNPITAGAEAPSVTIVGNTWKGDGWGTIGVLRSQTETVPTTTSTSGKWVFSVTPFGSTTPVDVLVINHDGSLLPIGDNARQLGSSSARWSNIWAANGTIQTSDVNAKTDIEDTPLGLDFINLLRPVKYRYKVGGNRVIRQVYLDKDGNEIPEGQPIPDDAVPGRIITEEVPGKRIHHGLIAQEVKEVIDKFGVDFGGFVIDENGEQGLRYDQFIAPLIKAVQELTKRVEKLETELMK